MKFKVIDTEIKIDEGLIDEDEEKIRKQLTEYRGGERKAFDLDVSFPDRFTGEVMREMAKIPYRETKSTEISLRPWTRVLLLSVRPVAVTLIH